ncbi:hypothetical protein FQZ97_1001260 [compost metagenome]
MAERNQLRTLLRRLDAGDARHGEYVALGVRAVDDHVQGFRAHAHAGLGHRFTVGNRLVGHIDHVRAALSIEMGQHG